VDGMRKVCRGITTFDEVYRVAKRTEQEHEAFAHILKEG
jgi:type IV pilus assembly protein PilB